MTTRKCKHCGLEVGWGQLMAHMKQCGAYQSNGTHRAQITQSTFDPVLLIASLDSAVIEQEIEATELKLKALRQLLTVAEAKRPAPEVRFTVPDRFDTTAEAGASA